MSIAGIPWPSSSFLICFVDRASLYNLVNRTNLVHNFFLNMCIAFLYMFRTTMCPSSGEFSVPVRHLVFFTLYRWLSGTQGGIFIPPCIPDSHPYRVTNTRCRICTVNSPDDGHIVARNMWRKAINILRKNCAPRWFHLQDSSSSAAYWEYFVGGHS